MRVKTVLAAGIVLDLLFRSGDDLDLYLYSLDHRHITYAILDKLQRDDGSVIIRIVKNYNSCELIEL
jgi:hypothetical protein